MDIGAMFLCVVLAGSRGVYDGDTFTCQDRTRIRLWGAAAPEVGRRAEKGGIEARNWMRAHIAGQPLVCIAKGKSHDRIVAQCFKTGPDIGASLVAAGHARDCPAFSGGAYASSESAASKELPLHSYCRPK